MLCRSSSGLRSAALGERVVATPAGDLGELHEHFVEEEAQPDALALASCAHHVHAVVPVAGTDERQVVLPDAQALQNGADTMVVQAGGLFGPAGQIVVGVLLRLDRATLDEGDRLIQHPGVPVRRT